MAITTVYSDGHIAIVDTDARWTNDANVANGNTTDYAYSSTYGPYQTPNNRLVLKGTSALPDGVGTITQVRMRGYGSTAVAGPFGGETLNINAHNAGVTPVGADPNLLGQVYFATTTTPGWSSYITLTAPSGGWTPTKLAELEVSCRADVSDEGREGRLYRVEFEVTYDAAVSNYGLLGFF